jgi:hypothetical protein
MMTMTTMHQGHVPGRARLVASGVGTMQSWQGRSVAPAFTGDDTTGVAAFRMNACAADHTTEPRAKGLIKRTARHLGTRST